MTMRNGFENWAAYVSARPSFNYAILFLITALAAALRFYKLGAWSLWIDEVHTINHATAHFSTLQLLLDNIPPARNWFPVSVILTAQVLNQWGINEFTARLVAAIFGVLTVPVLYFLVRYFFNVRVALITVLLLAVSPWHIDWSQNARGYTALLLFYLLALFAFHRAIEEDSCSYLILFFVFLYLASSERLIALFILPVIIAYLLALRLLPLEKPVGFRARSIYVLVSPLVLLVVYQLFSILQSGGSVFNSILDEIVNTFFGKPIETPVTQAVFMVFKLGIPLVAISILSAAYLFSQRNRQGMLVTLGAIIPVSLVILFTPFMFMEERYAFASLPCWLILSAIAIDTLLIRMKGRESILAFGILLVLLGSAMGENLMYFHSNHGNRWDWRSAFALVQANMEEGDIVVSTFPAVGNYYLQASDGVLWQDVNAESIVKDGHRVWFVVIPEMTWYTDTEDFYWWVAHNTRLIKVLYLRTVDNVSIEIYLYDPAVDLSLNE